MAAKKTVSTPASAKPYSYDPADIEVTEAARTFILNQLKEQSSSVALGVRVFLKTAGCSGKSYQIEPVQIPVSGDYVFGAPPLVVFAPSGDMSNLKGLKIDLQQDAFGQSLKFINPNEQGRCGCGQSFTVEPPTS